MIHDQPTPSDKSIFFGREIKLPSILFVGAILGLAACAKSSDEISAAYVSPLTYQDYSCRQIRAELGRLNRRVIEKTGAQDKAADSDTATMSVALILFWPALFFIDGDDQNTVEFARLKGEFEAAEKAAIKKDCDVSNEIAEARAAREAYEAERKNRGQDADPMTQ